MTSETDLPSEQERVGNIIDSLISSGRYRLPSFFLGRRGRRLIPEVEIFSDHPGLLCLNAQVLVLNGKRILGVNIDSHGETKKGKWGLMETLHVVYIHGGKMYVSQEHSPIVAYKGLDRANGGDIMAFIGTNPRRNKPKL